MRCERDAYLMYWDIPDDDDESWTEWVDWACEVYGIRPSLMTMQIMG